MDAKQKAMEELIQARLEELTKSGSDIALRLFPPAGHTMIAPEGNRMYIVADGKSEEFIGVSEAFYDLMDRVYND